MIDRLEVMMRKFNNRNNKEAKESCNENDEMIFDLTSPNKKNPMSYELLSVISLLKIIKDNIVLLDPVDLEKEKSMTISEFKT